MSNNKMLGSRFEDRFAELLSQHGFWVHLLTQNKAGQPADIIAVRNDKAFLIDCKVCSDGIFRTDRIEGNQRGSLLIWKECKNREWWFALEMPDGAVYMVPGTVADTWLMDNPMPYIRWADLEQRFSSFERWVARCE